MTTKFIPLVDRHSILSEGESIVDSPVLTYSSTLLELLSSIDPTYFQPAPNHDNEVLWNTLRAVFDMDGYEDGARPSEEEFLQLFERIKQHREVPKIDFYSLSMLIVQELSNNEIMEILWSLSIYVYSTKSLLTGCRFTDNQLQGNPLGDLSSAITKSGVRSVSDTRKSKYLSWMTSDTVTYPELTEQRVEAIQGTIQSVVTHILESMEDLDGYLLTMNKILCIRLLLKYTAFLSSFRAFRTEELAANNALQVVKSYHTGLVASGVSNSLYAMSESDGGLGRTITTALAHKRMQGKSMSPGMLRNLVFHRSYTFPALSSSYRQEQCCLNTLILARWYGLLERSSEGSLEELCFGRSSYAPRQHLSNSSSVAMYAAVGGVMVPWVEQQAEDPMEMADKVDLGGVVLVSDTDKTKVLNRVLKRIVSASPLVRAEVEHREVTSGVLDAVFQEYMDTVFTGGVPWESLDGAQAVYLQYVSRYSHGDASPTDIDADVLTDMRRSGLSALRLEQYAYGEIPPAGRAPVPDRGDLLQFDSRFGEYIGSSLSRYLGFRMSEPTVAAMRQKIRNTQDSNLSRHTLFLGEMISFIRDWQELMRWKHVHIIRMSVSTFVATVELDNTNTPYPVLTKGFSSIGRAVYWDDPSHSETMDELIGHVSSPASVRTGVADPTLDSPLLPEMGLQYSVMEGLLPKGLGDSPSGIPEGPIVTRALGNLQLSYPKKGEEETDGTFDPRFLFHPSLAITAYRKMSEAVDVAHKVYTTVEKMRC
jgi:hypothetical protein